MNSKNLATRDERKKAVVASIDDIAVASLGHAVAPVELSSEQRSRMRERIMTGIAPPANTLTVRGAAVEWRELWPKVWVQQLHFDPDSRVQMSVVRMEPGGVIPPHEHDHDEECLVLEGEIRLGDYYVRRGDFHIAKAGSRHADLLAPEGALLMIRSATHAPRIAI